MKRATKGKRRKKAKFLEAAGMFLWNNSLTLVLLVLFGICLWGYSYAGWREENQMLAAHGAGAVAFTAYLASADYWQAMASNWQAAIMQLACLIWLSVFLVQRGAPHSKSALSKKVRHRHKVLEWIYANSLTLAFVLMFFVAFFVHAVSGERVYNEQQALLHKPGMGVGEFLVSAKFWASTLETWQAEFLAIAIYIVLSVILRQEGSAESKPVGASHGETGEANK